MAKTVGMFSYVLGVVLVIGGLVTWFMVGSMLADQRITTPEGACLEGRTVSGPLTAYCTALKIGANALDATGGKTYAELDREDPLRQVAASASFLQASLFTSVVSFGVAAMGVIIGVLFILLGGAVNNFHSRMEGMEARGAPSV